MKCDKFHIKEVDVLQQLGFTVADDAESAEQSGDFKIEIIRPRGHEELLVTVIMANGKTLSFPTSPVALYLASRDDDD